MSGSHIKGLDKQIPHLRRYAQALTRDPVAADDLVQDCIERALKRSDSFKPGSNLRSWLFTLMHNLFIDECRKLRRRGDHVELEEWSPNAAVAEDQHWPLEMRDFLSNFRDLKKTDREILKMVAVEGLQYEVVAERLDIALGTVKSRLFRARKKLREMELERRRRRYSDKELAKTAEHLMAWA